MTVPVTRLRLFGLLLLSVCRISARRLLTNRRLAAGLLAGFTMAVAAASSVPAFTAGALQRVLQAELAADTARLPAAIHVAHFEDPRRKTTRDQFLAADQVAREQGPDLIGLPVSPLVRYGALELTRVTPVDRQRVTPINERWMALAFLAGMEGKITLYDGRLPLPGKRPDGFYEVIVEEEALEKQDFTVGAELNVPLNRSSSAPQVKAVVVGAFRRTNPLDPFWFQGGHYEQHLFVPEQTFVEQVLREERAVAGQYSWYFGVANQAVKITDVYRLLAALYDLEASMRQAIPDTELFESPVALLTRYAVRANELQLLLLLLAVPPLAVVAYFLVVTSGMMVEGQRQEIAVLRSRGASLWQIIAIYLLEGVLLAGLALAAGWPLGIGLARAMGAAAGFLQFVDRAQPPLLLPPDFWLYGAAAAALAVVAYVAPAIPAARQSIVSYKQESARKLRRPAWARWGLDLLALAAAGYAYYTLLGRPAGAGAAMEPLHILAPALLVAGGGLMALRLLPVMARMVARLAGRRAEAPLYLTLIQFSRSPGSYTPVILLLTLTVGMGLYSATAARTLEQNASDRVRYAGGADLVIEEVWEYVTEELNGITVVTEIIPPPWNVHYGLPGVLHPAAVRRQEVTPAIGGKSQRKATLLALDPLDFSQVAWFRRDLADAHLNAYLNLLAADEEAVLVSSDFLRRHKLKGGDRISLTGEGAQEVELVVYGALPYFPTLYPEEGDFFIANLEFIEQGLGLAPYQVWLKLEDGAKVQPIIDALKGQSILTLRADDQRQKLIRARREPVLNGLLGGMTNGFLVAAVITALGFLLYAALSLRARVLQFGVLRAMGLSAGQLIGAVALEQVATMGAGVAIGTGLGGLAARLFVPFLQTGSVTPPYLIVSDPADGVRLYGILVLLLCVGVAGLSVTISRLRIHEAVKLGEDS